MRFRFKASNNAAKYKASLVDLRLSREMQVKILVVNDELQLVVSQVNDNFTTRDKRIVIPLQRTASTSKGNI